MIWESVVFADIIDVVGKFPTDLYFSSYVNHIRDGVVLADII